MRKAALSPACVVLCALAAFQLTSCATKEVNPATAAAAAADAATGGGYKETAHDKVSLYRSGPGQMTMPDDTLAKNTLVKIMRTQFGYSFVQTDSGEAGWVANEDLKSPSGESIKPGDVLPENNVAQGGPNRAAGSGSASGPAQADGSTKTSQGDSAIVEEYTIPDTATKSNASPSPTPAP